MNGGLWDKTNVAQHGWVSRIIKDHFETVDITFYSLSTSFSILLKMEQEFIFKSEWVIVHLWQQPHGSNEMRINSYLEVL